MFKVNILEVLLDKNNNLETDKCLVLSSSKNISKNTLIKTLDKVQMIVNVKLNKRLKYVNRDNRVMFADFYQYAHNNTHSHTYLQIPECHDKDEVFKLVKDTFLRIDKRHRVHLENARHVYKLADYQSRQFNQNDILTYRFH